MTEANTDNQIDQVEKAFKPMTMTVEAGGKEYVIKPLVTRQIFLVLRNVEPIIDGLMQLVGTVSPQAVGSPLGGSADEADQPVNTLADDNRAMDDVRAYVKLIAEHGERIIELVAVALDIKISTAGNFQADETYNIVKAVIAVNKDFFMQRLAPIIGIGTSQPERNALANAVNQAISRKDGDGETHYNN